MKNPYRSAAVTLWFNRTVALVVFALLFALPALLDWYCQFRQLLSQERLAILIAFYCCAVVVTVALWNMDRLLQSILRQEVFTRPNVRRIRTICWCCGLTALFCLPATFFYYPLVFMTVVMGFLCLVVNVVATVMDAAVAIREENDLTV